MHKLLVLATIVLSLLVLCCKQSTPPEDNAEWVKNLITKYQNDSVGNPPQSIWRYEYKGQTVYYVPPQCCDQFSTLYNASGQVICAPDGGFSGTGDGRCSDFFQARKNDKLIWQDPRKR